jgi:hypothetical protein
MARPRIPLTDRFWPYVQKTHDCWLWTGFTHRQGYGRIWVRTRLELTHRVAWRLTYGPIPPGMCICHHCDNPRCVRPSHLFLGPQRDNVHDMEAKGRGKKCKGSQHHMTKLTDTDILTIRSRYAAGRTTQQTLADRYNVTPSTIGKIIRREQWRHLK